MVLQAPTFLLHMTIWSDMTRISESAETGRKLWKDFVNICDFLLNKY